MAGKSMILTLSIIGKSDSAQNALGETTNSASKFKDGMAKANVAAVGTLAAIGGLAKISGEAASDLQQSAGAVESVFKGAAGEVTKLSDAAAKSVGLSKNQYNELASVLGAQLKNLGVAQDEIVGTTDGLITKGADLAATFGGTTADAVGALTSAFRGETDPIEKYGISIKQADINAKMAEMGMTGLTGEAEKQARTQALLAMITEQSADATGQFARETDSAAGAQQIATAQWENAKAALGEALLPLMVEWAGALADLAAWISENSTLVTIMVGVIGGLAAAIVVINAGMAAYNAIIAVTTALKLAENAAWLASPVTWIVVGIVAALALLVGGFVLAYNKVEWFRNGVDTMMSGVQYLFTHPLEVWQATMGAVGDGIKWVLDGIGIAIDWVIDKLGDLRDAWNNFWSFSGGGDVNAFSTFSAPPTTFAAQTVAAFSTPANVEPQAAASPLAVQRAIGATTGSSSSTAPQRVIVDVNLNNGLVSDPVKLGNEIRRALEGAL